MTSNRTAVHPSHLITSILALGIASTGLADSITLLDQVGPMDGSALTGGLSASQYFEEAYTAYDIATIDDFMNDAGAIATQVSGPLGGWNGYAGIDGVTGVQVNFYNTLMEAGENLVGYVSEDFAGTPTGDPEWTHDSDLLTFNGNWIINGDRQSVAIIPVNEFAANGQTGIVQSSLGDGISWQANPNGGFGFGPYQESATNAALRVMGSEGDPCNANLPENCTADVNADNVVNVDDLLAVISTFGDAGDGTYRPLGDCAPLPNGDCLVNVDDVLAVISGFGADCTPSGACCAGFDPCTVQTQADCDAIGGTYAGDDTDCGVCTWGACCDAAGNCVEDSGDNCTASGGVFNDGMTCDEANCQPIIGACCVDAQTCLDAVDPVTCDAFGGEFVGDGSTCATAPCGWPGCDNDDTAEGIPCQGDTDGDFYDENGGNNSDPPSFGNIAVDETICGTMSTFTCIGCGTDGTDVTYRDTDWYAFSNADGGTYTVSGGGQGPLVIAIIRLSTGSFEGYVVTETYAQDSVTVTIGAGDDYAVWVGHDWNSGIEVPCDSGLNEYTVNLTRVDAPVAACCMGLECVGDLNPTDCLAAGGEYVAGESCATYACPEAYEGCTTGNGQDPTLSGWWAGTSDTGTGYIRYEDITADTVSSVRVWGITAFYSGGWSACSDTEMSFDASLHEDDGTGYPGTVTGELIGHVADQAPLDVDLGAYTLHRFDMPLMATTPSSWLRVTSNGTSCWFLWLSASADGEGTSLLDNNGTWETATRDLAICITP